MFFLQRCDSLAQDVLLTVTGVGWGGGAEASADLTLESQSEIAGTQAINDEGRPLVHVLQSMIETKQALCASCIITFALSVK